MEMAMAMMATTMTTTSRDYCVRWHWRLPESQRATEASACRPDCPMPLSGLAILVVGSPSTSRQAVRGPTRGYCALSWGDIPTRVTSPWTCHRQRHRRTDIDVRWSIIAGRTSRYIFCIDG